MEGQGEGGCVGGTVQGIVEQPFGAVGQGEVDHPTALAAHQVMVMMLGEVFGQLVVRVFVAGGDAADEAGLLEQVLSTGLRSSNPDRRREAVDSLDSLAALASHVRHLILVQELRAVVSSIPNVSAEDH